MPLGVQVNPTVSVFPLFQTSADLGPCGLVGDRIALYWFIFTHRFCVSLEQSVDLMSGAVEFGAGIYLSNSFSIEW